MDAGYRSYRRTMRVCGRCPHLFVLADATSDDYNRLSCSMYIKQSNEDSMRWGGWVPYSEFKGPRGSLRSAIGAFVGRSVDEHTMRNCASEYYRTLNKLREL